MQYLVRDTYIDLLSDCKYYIPTVQNQLQRLINNVQN